VNGKGKWWKEIQEKTGKLNTYSSVRRRVLHENGKLPCFVMHAVD
jgi:hypothetical protein